MMRYLWTSIKMQFRIPISIFFSLMFPIIMMFAMVTSYGNFDIGNGFHFIDKYFLISAGMGIMPLSLISFPIWLGESIQNKSYKRLEYFGLNSYHMISADVLVYVLLTLLSIIGTILFGFLMYDLYIPSFIYVLSYIVQCLYANLVLLILGAIIALLVKKTNVLMPLGMILLFSCYIFTGTFSSFSDLPLSFQAIGKCLPMKYVMNNFFDVWTEKNVLIQNFLVLNTFWGIVLACLLIAVLAVRQRNKLNCLSRGAKNEKNS